MSKRFSYYKFHWRSNFYMYIYFSPLKSLIISTLNNFDKYKDEVPKCQHLDLNEKRYKVNKEMLCE